MTVQAGTHATSEPAGARVAPAAAAARSDEELMLAFGAGERDAFAEIFERYQAPVGKFFRRRVADASRADELAQETFLGVIQAAPRYRPTAAFRSYLFGVAFNVLLAWRRKARRRGEEEMSEIDPPARTADPDTVIWVRRALAGLDAMDRDVLMLREYEQLSYDEIAGVMGVPIGTVRSRLFRARMALREQLGAAGRPLGVQT